MKPFMIVHLICAALLLLASCSREDYRRSLVGTWEWTGDSCGTDGNCKKEIITDEENREVFTGDGLYISKRAKIGYILDGAEIRLASDTDKFNSVYGEIVSIKNGIMLLKKDAGTRRYSRIDGAR